MLLKLLLIFGFIATSKCSSLNKLFPLNQEYVYEISSDIDTGVLEPRHNSMSWLTEGYLHLRADDSRVRMQLHRFKTRGCCAGGSNFGYSEIQKSYAKPWEIEMEDGRIKALHVPMDDPEWMVNFKRAVSLSFQLVLQDDQTYTVDEPSLHSDACETTYVKYDDKIVKYSSSSGYLNSTISAPDGNKAPLEASGVQRTFSFHERTGLTSVLMEATYRHTTQQHRLGVTATLSIKKYYNTHYSILPKFREDISGLRKTSVQYVWDPKDPSNGLQIETQQELRSEAYQLLHNITAKYRDRLIIAKEPFFLHKMSFLNLLNTLVKLTYDSLKNLYEDLTASEDASSMEMFLEVLPYVTSSDALQFVNYLMTVKQNSMLKQSLVTLIRKLAFTSLPLTEEMVQHLGFPDSQAPEFKEVRHAGALTSASLVHKADVSKTFLDNMQQKYLADYRRYDHHEEKLVYLQGLYNLKFSGFENIYSNSTNTFYERFWSLLSMNPSNLSPESLINIIITETEDIRLRVAAVHLLFSLKKPKLSNIQFVHNCIKQSKSKILNKFWFSTVNNFKENKEFITYKETSQFLAYIQDNLLNAGPQYWGTFNHIQSGEDQDYTQVLSVQELGGGMPAFVAFSANFGGKLDSGEKQRYKIDAYLLMEGVAPSVMRSIFNVDRQDMKLDDLVQVLQRLGAYATVTEKVHVDLVVRLYDQTVLASHLSQSTFDSWLKGLNFLKDFISFGNIERQKVFIPFQHDVTMVTEIGTPLRLQTLVHSYASARGNLTMKDMTISSDLLLRYHSASVTKLTGYGFGNMTNFAALQQVMVAELPLDFNLIVSPSEGLDLKWSLEGPRRPSLVMHSWAPAGLHVNNTGLVYISETSDMAYRYANIDKYDEVEDYFIQNFRSNSIYYDECHPPMAGGEALAKLFAPDSDYYDRLTSIQPSISFLTSKFLFSSHSLGSCGFHLQPFNYHFRDKQNHTLHATLNANQIQVDNSKKTFLSLFLKYGSKERSKTTSFDMDAVAMMESKAGFDHIQLTVHASQPEWDGKKEWKVFVQEYNISHEATYEYHGHWKAKPFNSDFSVSYSGPEVLPNKSAASLFSLNYDGKVNQYRVDIYDPQFGNISKHIEIDFNKISLSDMGILKMDALKPFQEEVKTCRPVNPWYSDEPTTCNEKPLKIEGSLDTDSYVAISSSQINDIFIRDDNALSFFNSWTYLPVLNSIGLYHQCRVYAQQYMQLQTLNHEYNLFYPYWCNETVLAADCTANPRFAVIRNKAGVVVYSGGHKLTVTDTKSGKLVVDDSQGGNEFWYTSSYKAKIILWKTGVQVFYYSPTIMIFVPNMYLSSTCGACTDQARYNTCPSQT